MKQNQEQTKSSITVAEAVSLCSAKFLAPEKKGASTLDDGRFTIDPEQFPRRDVVSFLREFCETFTITGGECAIMHENAQGPTVFTIKSTSNNN